MHTLPAEERAKRAREVERNKNLARLSLLDMEIEQDKGGAHIAPSVAWGYGPALSMPTLMGMMGGGGGEGQEGTSEEPDGGQVHNTTAVKWAIYEDIVMYTVEPLTYIPWNPHLIYMRTPQYTCMGHTVHEG